MRRGLCLAAVAALAATATGCTSAAVDEPGRADRVAVGAPAAPVVVKDCWVPTSIGNVSLRRGGEVT